MKVPACFTLKDGFSDICGKERTKEKPQSFSYLSKSPRAGRREPHPVRNLGIQGEAEGTHSRANSALKEKRKGGERKASSRNQVNGKEGGYEGGAREEKGQKTRSL